MSLKKFFQNNIVLNVVAVGVLLWRIFRDYFVGRSAGDVVLEAFVVFAVFGVTAFVVGGGILFWMVSGLSLIFTKPYVHCLILRHDYVRSTWREIQGKYGAVSVKR